MFLFFTLKHVLEDNFDLDLHQGDENPNVIWVIVPICLKSTECRHFWAKILSGILSCFLFDL